MSAPSASLSAGAVFTDFDHSIYDGDAEVSEWGRWGRRGWRRNRVRGGDVLTGVLILGGIAAIASAANSNNRRDRDIDYRRERTNDRDDYRRNERRDPRRSDSGSGLDSAVDQCVSRIERDIRVETVDSVDRTAQGWTVTGALFNGGGFTCQIDANGQIADINYSGFQGSNFDTGNVNRARGADLQWTDARYGAARDRMNTSQQSAGSPSEPQPAYPGGPLPGEQFPDDVDADLNG
ncbi:hypothetical protein FGU71_11010 [Erythrobacter insulae]|uniref:Uncharacterized protein n=1 Tax=Erythrobacter insulae TaxID=2584124 RepID=A0A547PFC5_9SPHN|nr:hypothetical protein FGU71_11010 [Erythrobacter insulae]